MVDLLLIQTRAGAVPNAAIRLSGMTFAPLLL